jgi:hypothetical protein
MFTFDDTHQQCKETDPADIDELLSEALERLHPRYRSPVSTLFALDGLGHKPRMENMRGDRDGHEW